MRICPRCRREYPTAARRCEADGVRLVDAAEFEAAGRDPLLGVTLGARYTLTGRIGVGGMGTVYRAEQSPVGREVAVKVLRRELSDDPETVARFKREAHTLSQLRHPNTVTIFDAGRTDDGLLYLAMELLEGEMLSARIRREGSVAPEEAVRIAMGVLRSLDEAHAAGIIHRDLKPDNIFLARVHGRPEEAEVVKVVDFGIAKIRDGDRVEGLDPVATQEGTVFGTPRYMSPEQAQGRALDGRSDLYAVGVLLFHMMTGNAPFTEDDAVVVMAHHIQTVPPRLREVVPEAAVPATLEALVADALAKDPLRRPQTAADFLSRLEGLLPEVKTARLSVVTDTRRASASPRASWALGLGVLLAVAILGSRMLLRDHHDPPPALTAARHAPPAAPTALATPAPAPAPSAPTPAEAPTEPPQPAPRVATPTRAAAPAARAVTRMARRRQGASTRTPTPPQTPVAEPGPASANTQPYRRWDD